MLFIVSFNFKTFGQEVWTIGPMLHYNFGGEKNHFSWAIELAYWNVKNVPYSIDGGIEFNKKRIRLYSEVQTGIGVAGLSVGPVLEINKAERKAHLGYQTTFWVNYFIGVDYRYRRIDKTNFNRLEYVQDFKLSLDKDLRLSIEGLIVPDGIEKNKNEQAF